MTDQPHQQTTMSRFTAVALWSSIGCVGLMAGIFFAFTISVMPGLADSDDHSYVVVFQNINKEIENLLFGLVFVGALFLPVLAAILLRAQYKNRAASLWAWIGLALYVVTLIITMAVNIPLNDALAAVNVATGDVAKARHDFEGPWVASNIVRTITNMGSFAALTWAAFARKK